MVTAIEEERDIAKLSLEELSGSLQAHEPKVLRSNEKPEEKTFYAKGNLRDVENLEDTYGRGRGGTMREGGEITVEAEAEASLLAANPLVELLEILPTKTIKVLVQLINSVKPLIKVVNFLIRDQQEEA